MMGLDESKLISPHRCEEFRDKLCLPAPVTLKIIHQCSPATWIQSHRENLNFSDKPITCNYRFPHECTPSFCLSRQTIVNCRKPRSMFLRKRKKNIKMAEHFEYNHIPARLSSIQNLHFKSVLATHCGLAVVHLARDMIIQFAVLDMKINKFLGSFGRQTVNYYHPEQTLGKISPDGCWCLVKLPSNRNRRVPVLKLYDLKCYDLLAELPLSPAPSLSVTSPSAHPLGIHQDDNRQRPNPFSECEANNNHQQLPTSVANRSGPVMFAFDPRFMHARIVITNLAFSYYQLEDEQMSISLIQLPTWERIRTITFTCPTIASSYSSSSAARQRSPPRSPGGTQNSGVLPRRRRVSEATDDVTSHPSSSLILNVFFSKDGFLLFVLFTGQRSCRCGVVGQLSSNLFSSSSDSVGQSSTTSYPSERGQTINPRLDQSKTNPRASRCTTQKGHVIIDSMYSPTLPGCTTLWLAVFNSDNLKKLHTLRFDRPICPLHTCPTNYLPVMSRCGSRLALLANQHVIPRNVALASNSRELELTSKLNAQYCMLSATPCERTNHESIGSDCTLCVVPEQQQVGSSRETRRSPECTRSTEIRPPTFDRVNPTLLSKVVPFSRHNHMASNQLVPTALVPHSSSGRQIKVMRVYQLPPPLYLQAIARRKIRQFVRDSQLYKLNLPACLINYLRFEPTFACAGSCISRSDSTTTPTPLLASQTFDFTA